MSTLITFPFQEAIARERTWAVGTFDFNRKQMLQNKLVDLQNIVRNRSRFEP
jgi:hypothetical protein